MEERNQTELCELDRRIATEKQSAFSMRTELKSVARELAEIEQRLSPLGLENFDLADPEVSGRLAESTINDIARKQGLHKFMALLENRIVAAESVVARLGEERAGIIAKVESRLRWCRDIRGKLNGEIPAEQKKLDDAADLFRRQTQHTEKQLLAAELEIPKLCPGDVVAQLRLKIESPFEGNPR